MVVGICRTPFGNTKAVLTAVIRLNQHEGALNVIALR